MCKHFAYSVDVSTIGNQERCVGVAEAVKGDFLLDARIFEPFLKRFPGVGAAQLRPLNTMPWPGSPQYERASSLSGNVACVLVFWVRMRIQ